MRRTVVIAAFLLGACANATTPSTITPTAVATTTAPLPPDTAGGTTTSPPATSAPATSPPGSAPVPPPPSTTPLDELTLHLEEVASGFTQPVLALAPAGDGRLFVVDQVGMVWVVAGSDPEPFLDIRDDVIFQGEQGLLGLAFHPQFATNGLFYVDYVGRGRVTRIVEFRADGDRADGGRVVLEVSQPAGNHNGGMIAFGPDGYLWIAMGDGGGAGDSYGNGQRADTLLGAMLRIAVGPGVAEPYGIPPDNPFVDGGGAPEVWATGLRNPWRFAFDGGLLYVADVGQNEIEEVDVVSVTDAGANFGWPIMEGDRCFRATSCDSVGLVAPAVVYTHADGCSVTGGFVYRGAAIPELDGHYFFGDFCGGWVRSLHRAGDGVEVREWFEPRTVPGLTSFGLDAAGELYVTLVDGRVLRLVRG